MRISVRQNQWGINSKEPIIQVLLNRGIPISQIPNYLNSTDKDINDPEAFGAESMLMGAKMLMRAIVRNRSCLIVVDCDTDGYTSSAILINYLFKCYPAWTQNKLRWYMHENKQHGLSDCIEEAKKYNLVICPDSSSNDYEYHKILKDAGVDVLVLDHHEAEQLSNYAWVINNQQSDYPNKSFSGAGVTWQFCRYLDKLLEKNLADDFIDLVALGNIADMMSLASIETKHVINKGLKNIKNPFFEAMIDKNAYSIGDDVTPIGVAFYVAPFVNAMTRSGTVEEKELLFSSMLEFKAYNKIPSTKRGHKLGAMETVLEQAVRTCTNVKNRQTRAQDAGLALLEKMIEENHLLDHKVLTFILEPGQLDRNIAGLVANKFMAKYQRPCCVLTKVKTDKGMTCQGSARGYGKLLFKDLCAMIPSVMYSEGHQGAFGLGVNMENGGLDQFIEFSDELLKDFSAEITYDVDYLFDGNMDTEIAKQAILDISNLEHLWGQDMPESLVAFENVEITSDMVQIFTKKDNTIKINLSDGISLMKFHASDEECNLFKRENFGKVFIDVVGTCHTNTWGPLTSPQLFIEDYNVTYKTQYMPSADDF